MKGRLVSALHLKSRASPPQSSNNNGKERVAVPPPRGGRNPLLDLAPPIHRTPASTNTEEEEEEDKPRPRKQPSLKSLPSETSIFFSKYTGESMRSIDTSSNTNHHTNGGLFAAPFANVRDDEEDDHELNQLRLLSANMLNSHGVSSNTNNSNTVAPRAPPMAAIEDVSEHSENDLPASPTTTRQPQHQQQTKAPPSPQQQHVARAQQHHQQQQQQQQRPYSASASVTSSLSATNTSGKSSMDNHHIEELQDLTTEPPPHHIQLLHGKSQSRHNLEDTSHDNPRKKGYRLKHMFGKSTNKGPQDAHVDLAADSKKQPQHGGGGGGLANIFHRSRRKDMPPKATSSPASFRNGLFHPQQQDSSDGNSSGKGSKSQQWNALDDDHASWPNPAQPLPTMPGPKHRHGGANFDEHHHGETNQNGHNMPPLRPDRATTMNRDFRYPGGCSEEQPQRPAKSVANHSHSQPTSTTTRSNVQPPPRGMMHDSGTQHQPSNDRDSTMKQDADDEWSDVKPPPGARTNIRRSISMDSGSTKSSASWQKDAFATRHPTVAYGVAHTHDLDSIPPYARAAAAAAAASGNMDQLPQEFLDAMAPHLVDEVEDEAAATQRLQQEELDRALARRLMEEEDAEAARRMLDEQRRVDEEGEFLARQLIIEEEAEYERRRNETLGSAFFDQQPEQQQQPRDRPRRVATDPQLERRRREEREALQERRRRMEQSGMYRRAPGPREGGPMGAPPHPNGGGPSYPAPPPQRGVHPGDRRPNNHPIPRHSTGGIRNREAFQRGEMEDLHHSSLHSAPNMHIHARVGGGPQYSPENPYGRPIMRPGSPDGPPTDYYGGGPRPVYPPQQEQQPPYYDPRGRGGEYMGDMSNSHSSRGMSGAPPPPRDPLASMMQRRRASLAAGLGSDASEVQQQQPLVPQPPPPDHIGDRYYGGGDGRDFYPPPARMERGPSQEYGNYQEAEQDDDQVWVEISPGLQVALRKSMETREAIANDFFQQVSCLGCSMDMFTVADANYIICPACRFVSPLEGIHDERFGDCHRHGLGMGVTNEQLIQIQAEFLIER